MATEFPDFVRYSGYFADGYDPDAATSLSEYERDLLNYINGDKYAGSRYHPPKFSRDDPRYIEALEELMGKGCMVANTIRLTITLKGENSIA